MRSLFSMLLLLTITILPQAQATGPYVVKDIYPGTGTSPKPPNDLTPVGNKLFFVAYAPDMGVELWISNGTQAGTVVVKDIWAGLGNSDPKIIGSTDDILFFEAGDGVSSRGIWRSDGTASGTFKINNMTVPWNADDKDKYTETVGNTFLFTGRDSSSGTELWKSDGTAAGTVMVKDIYTGNSELPPYGAHSSGPAWLTSVNGIIFFQSLGDINTGVELWKSDGTTAGTVMVKDINTSFYLHSSPSYLTNVNGTLFFAADDETHGVELWKSDGTATGTILVKDINLNSNDSGCSNLINVNGALLFSAQNGIDGGELWKSDGSAAGTTMVKDIHSGSSSSNISFLTIASDVVFFRANDGTHGNELWKSDGTAAGTVIVKDIQPGADGSFLVNLASVNDTIFFTALLDAEGDEIWKSNGTATGTVKLKDIYPSFNVSSPQFLTSVNGFLFFRAMNGGTYGEELWALNTNGTPPIIASISNTTAPDNHAYTGSTPVLTTGTTPITWTLIQKPTGMTINSATGVVSWPTPTTTGSPFTIKIRATNDFGQADATWTLTVYHPGPPSTPQGGLEVTYHVKTPSTSPDGQTVLYTYVWTSDKGDRVTHGPTAATSDTLTEMSLVQDGETWTVTVTPRSGTTNGTAATASVKFVDVRSGVWVWALFR